MTKCVMSLLQKFYLLLFGSDVLGKCALENKLEVWCMCWAVVPGLALEKAEAASLQSLYF